MQTATQISVTLVNKPGRLSAILEAMAKEKVQFKALSVMDSGERGTLRFVPDNRELAVGVLVRANVSYDVADVLLVEIPQQNGAFRNACERLASEHLNIDYAYCAFTPLNGGKSGPIAVVKVNNLAKAQKVLSESGNGVSRQKKVGRRPVHAR